MTQIFVKIYLEHIKAENIAKIKTIPIPDPIKIIKKLFGFDASLSGSIILIFGIKSSI